MPTDTDYRSNVQAAAEAVRRGGVIVYPTETVWGIGCDATNAEAVARVYKLKRRADAKAMITLVADIAMLERYVEDIPDVAYQLLEAAVEPVTVVYDSPVGLAGNLRASDGSAAVRVTSAPFARDVCRAARKPIVSTSANLSGGATPRRFADIPEELIAGADFVADVDRERISERKPSTMIKISAGGLFKILRS